MEKTGDNPPSLIQSALSGEICCDGANGSVPDQL
jgi:hypothetical protein